MLGTRRLALAKAVLLQWTQQIYRRREQLAVIGFAGATARLLQPPRKAVAFNESWIGAIAGGGGTPALAAIELADRVLGKVRRNAPQQGIALWLLSDVRFARLPPRPQHADVCVVVDFDDAAVAAGRAAQLARAWDAPLLRPQDLLGD